MELLCHPTQDSFNELAIVPFAFIAVSKVPTGTSLFPKTKITERNRLTFVLFYQLTERIIMFIRAIPTPIGNLTILIDEERDLNTANPATICLALTANLLFRTTFTAWMDEFNAKRGNDTKHT
jgi:hypothetical protein